MAKRKQNGRFADTLLRKWRINYTTLLRFFTFAPFSLKCPFRRSKAALLMVKSGTIDVQKGRFRFVNRRHSILGSQTAASTTAPDSPWKRAREGCCERGANET